MPFEYYAFTLLILVSSLVFRDTLKYRPAVILTLVFAAVQFIVAFPVQMKTGKFSWSTQLSTDEIRKAFVVLILFYAVYLIAHVTASTLGRTRFQSSPASLQKQSGNRHIWLLGTTLVVFAIFYVIYGNVLFHPRNERYLVLSEASQLALMHALQFLGALCALATFESCRQLRFRGTVMLVAFAAIGVGALLVNPIAFPRNYFLGFAFSYVLLQFGIATAFPIASISALAGSFLFIPSFLKSFQTGWSCFGLECIPGAGDFDAFTVVAVAGEYAKEFGYRGLDVLFGLLGFFIPRTMWASKPISSNELIFNYLGYSFNNLSFPIPAEGFFGFGYFGVVVAALLFYGYCYYIDRLYHSGSVGKRTLGAFLCASIYMTVRGPVTGIVPPLLYGVTGFAFLLLTPRLLRRFGQKHSFAGEAASGLALRTAKVYGDAPGPAALRPSKGGLPGIIVAIAGAIGAVGLLCSPAGAAETPQVPQPDPAAWSQIRQIAENYVAQESPDTVWPFERLAPGTAPDRKGVFPHYFVPFPVSFENDPPERDYYARNYLTRAGEHNKFFRQGGYLRERPLPLGPWKSPYWRQIDMAIEIYRARLMGADGFGVDLLNLNPGEHWTLQRMMFDVAAAVAPDFRIIPEPDMNTLRSTSQQDLENELEALWHHPASYHLPDGRMLIVPFYAEQRPPGFWKDLIDDMATRGAPVAFMPDFLNPKPAALYAGLSYGMTFWGDRDVDAIEKGGLVRTAQLLRMLTRVWMAPVIPQDVRPKDSNFFEAHNSALFRSLWEAALSQNANYVHLITWNDYSEGSEIAPSSGTQFVFYDLSAYYTSWFKSGREPRITKDAIYYLHRRQIYEPGRTPRPDDIPMKLRGETPVSNDVEMIAFLVRPATLEIEEGGQRYDLDVPAGLQVFRVPAQVGRPVFRIRRDGTVIVEKQSDWTIAANPDAQDPLYVGGSTTRPFARS